LIKIIANGLKRVIQKRISENKGGFIQNRWIMDNILLVKEAIHSIRRRKEKKAW